MSHDFYLQEDDLIRAKEMININMNKDLDYDKMTREERERLVGPERLISLHKALQKIGVSLIGIYNCLFISILSHISSSFFIL
jgi:hypothetical protein